MQLMEDPEELEVDVFRRVASGWFVHEVAHELGIVEGLLYSWMAETDERREKWLDAHNLGQSVIRSRIRSELARVAFFDVRKLYTETGKLKEVNDWPDSESRAVSMIHKQEGVGKDGAPWESSKIKLESKLKANELLGKEVGMFVERKIIKVSSLEDVLSQSWEPDSESEAQDAEVVGEVAAVKRIGPAGNEDGNGPDTSGDS